VLRKTRDERVSDGAKIEHKMGEKGVRCYEPNKNGRKDSMKYPVFRIQARKRETRRRILLREEKGTLMMDEGYRTKGSSKKGEVGK